MDETLDYQFAGISPLERAEFASFWERVGATLMDVVIFIPLIGLAMYNTFSLKSLPIALAITFLSILYKPLMEWEYGATLGKMILKIKVVTEDLKKISLPTALIRYALYALQQVPALLTTFWLFKNEDYQYADGFAEVSLVQAQTPYQMLSYATSFIIIVAILAFFASKKKQTLYDLMAKTYVVKKSSIPADTLIQE